MLLSKYDYVIQLRLHDAVSDGSNTHDHVDDGAVKCQRLYQVFERALGDRVDLIDILRPETELHAVDPTIPYDFQSKVILVGFLTSDDKIHRAIDKGPFAEHKSAAADFRKFWGEKAELRRFKDGTIQESLVWSTAESDHSIFVQIISHVLQRHFGTMVTIVRVMGEDFSQLLNHCKVNEGGRMVSVVQPNEQVIQAFEKQIRSIDGLPLHVRQVIVPDTQMPYTSSHVPSTRRSIIQTRPFNIHLQFEGSSRWPDSFTAMQSTKAAFLLKVGELLGDVDERIETRIGLEALPVKLGNLAFLDVTSPSGPAFRIRIHHEHEVSLLERELSASSSSNIHRQAEAASLSAYKRNFLQAPKHTQAVTALCTRFTFLAPTICLLKKWRDCHLLSDHICDQLLELLAIRTFIHPGIHSTPGSTMAGFLRTLGFLVDWDWRIQPLILDITGEMSTRDIEDIEKKFNAWRQIDPAMNRVVMFAASNIDREGITWTEFNPSKVVAARFTGLVRAAMTLVKEHGMSLRAESLFVPSLVDYDFVLFLDTRFSVPNNNPSSKPTAFKNLQLLDNPMPPLTGHSLSNLFMGELRDLHSRSILFFYDAEKCDVICGLWHPDTDSRPWKVGLEYSTKPDKQGVNDVARVGMNKTAALNNIARLGGELITRIERRR